MVFFVSFFYFCRKRNCKNWCFLRLFLLFFFQFSKIILFLFPRFPKQKQKNFRSFDLFLLCRRRNTSQKKSKERKLFLLLFWKSGKRTKIIFENWKKNNKKIARTINFCSSFSTKKKRNKELYNSLSHSTKTRTLHAIF